MEQALYAAAAEVSKRYAAGEIPSPETIGKIEFFAPEAEENSMGNITPKDEYGRFGDKQGTAKVDSRYVADEFGKEHKNVLRDIESLDCSSEFLRLNFEPIFYRDEYGSFEERKQILSQARQRWLQKGIKKAPRTPTTATGSKAPQDKPAKPLSSYHPPLTNSITEVVY